MINHRSGEVSTFRFISVAHGVAEDNALKPRRRQETTRSSFRMMNDELEIGGDR